ncbi:MAG: glycine cleavage system protein GcvH [Lachnospiraceae bacterium]|nr:glycine cleavage system protein GcvH [Lachnospiraceae bacterium]
MNTPEELRYTRDHEWVKEEDGLYVIGITDYAQDALGDIVFVNLPEIDDEFDGGDAVCDVESVKAVSDVLTPVTGKVVEINEDLLDAPEMVNEDPYGAWFVKMEGEITVDLLDAAAYEAHCEDN